MVEQRSSYIFQQLECQEGINQRNVMVKNGWNIKGRGSNLLNDQIVTQKQDLHVNVEPCHPDGGYNWLKNIRIEYWNASCFVNHDDEQNMDDLARAKHIKERQVI